jgi:hypothetical protein
LIVPLISLLYFLQDSLSQSALWALMHIAYYDIYNGELAFLTICMKTTSWYFFIPHIWPQNDKFWKFWNGAVGLRYLLFKCFNYWGRPIANNWKQLKTNCILMSVDIKDCPKVDINVNVSCLGCSAFWEAINTHACLSCLQCRDFLKEMRLENRWKPQ